MQRRSKEILDAMTPEKALVLLKEGNQRFAASQMEHRNLMEQVVETKKEQFPFAVVLGCIDSRVPPELIFDQGIGDIFSIRIAGNFVNEDILGSMEFACKLIGSKLIVVLGHNQCGAIHGAYHDIRLGHLTGLVRKLKPAVDAVPKNGSSLDQIAIQNVHMAVANITQQSLVLHDLMAEDRIAVMGAMYDVSSGVVSFL